MTASFILLSAVLCISITLFAYLFYSISFVSRILRTKSQYLFDIRLILITLLLYALIFVAIESIFLYQEGYSFFDLSWPVKASLFSLVTILVIGVIRLVAGGLLISAPQFYVEKMISLYGNFEDDSVLFLEIIVELKGEVILDALDERIIIARLPLASFKDINSWQEVIIECTFSEHFLKNALVQIVCYPASRGVFIEKTTISLVLDYLGLRYTEKIIKSLS